MATNIPKLIEAYASAKLATKSAYEAAKSTAMVEQEVKQKLDEALVAIGTKTFKTPDGRFTAFYTKRSNVTVIDEARVLEWIAENKLDASVYIGLKASAFVPVAKEALKTTGEIVPGTAVVESESLSLKENK